MTIADVLEETALGLAGVEWRREAGGTEYAVGGAVFAAVSADGAEFRLEPVVGRAARATADTAASGRGPEWVAFNPRQLDRYAIDRASAWFGSAYRLAARTSRG